MLKIISLFVLVGMLSIAAVAADYHELKVSNAEWVEITPLATIHPESIDWDGASIHTIVRRMKLSGDDSAVAKETRLTLNNSRMLHEAVGLIQNIQVIFSERNYSFTGLVTAKGFSTGVMVHMIQYGELYKILSICNKKIKPNIGLK